MAVYRCQITLTATEIEDRLSDPNTVFVVYEYAEGEVVARWRITDPRNLDLMKPYMEIAETTVDGVTELQWHVYS